MDVASLYAGQAFAGDYRILRSLSTGGMGAVYVAEQISTGKERALKLMKPELLHSPELRRRFELEARIGAKIDSDHVVEVVGAGVDRQSDVPWLAMELLSGESLAAMVARLGPLQPAMVGEIFDQLCHALSLAHAQGIVHRDLKPENLFVARTRRKGSPFTVKILDFGISKVVAEAKTKMTEAVGTPLWMAPEQTQAGSSVSPATDVWALGLIAFWLLTGKSYWLSAMDSSVSTIMILREVLMDPLDPASVRAARFGRGPLPAGFDDWFARCLARPQSDRFAHAEVMHTALSAVLGGPQSSRMQGSMPGPAPAERTSLMSEPGFTAPMPGPPRSGPAPAMLVRTPPAVAFEAPRRSRAWILVSAVGAALALAAMIWGVTRPAQKRDDPPAESTPTQTVAGTIMRDAPVSNTVPTPSSVAPAPTTSPAVVSVEPTHSAPTAPSTVGTTQRPSAPGAAPLEKTLTSEQATGVVSHNKPAVRRTCWDPLASSAGPDAPSSSKVNLTLHIGPDGSVTQSTATGGAGYPGLAGCVQGAARGWKFPATEQGGTVSVPFSFSRQ